MLDLKYLKIIFVLFCKPLDVRELVPEKAKRIDKIGLYGENIEEVKKDVAIAMQCETGR